MEPKLPLSEIFEHWQVAADIWNEAYPDRRKFEEIDVGAQYEWCKFVKLAKKHLIAHNKVNLHWE